MPRGYVYVLSNPSMKGLVKIGRSETGGNLRARSLHSTGVPTPFHLEFELLADDAAWLEQAVHERLENFRVHQGREFFKCPPHFAIEAILGEFASAMDLAVCAADDFQAVEAAERLSYVVEEHPVTVCQAFNFIDKQSLLDALKRRQAWIDQRTKDKTA